MDEKSLNLSEAIYFLGREISELRRQREREFEVIRSHLEFATKMDLRRMEHRIMRAIEEFAAKQKDFQDRLETAVNGLSQDIAALNEEILKLQNSAGTITPEDQTLLDGIVARSQAAVEKAEALDALTPPKPPTT